VVLREAVDSRPRTERSILWVTGGVGRQATVEPVGSQSYLAANRANWDERTEVHVGSRFYNVDGWLRELPGPGRHELEILGDVAGLHLLHLQCHLGLDTLAWAMAGATVTGVDFSERAIATAEGIAGRAGLTGRARFVCSDVYEASSALDGEVFDIVYVSLGSLCWLPDVAAWATEVSALLGPGGRFYIHDVHPLALALDGAQPLLVRSYFEEEAPWADDSGGTYTDATRPLVNRRSYEWNHGLGETVSALTRAGLRLEWLAGHDWTLFRHFPWLVQDVDGHWVIPPGAARLPLSFSLLAVKQSSAGTAPSA
jgi:SAM-dependent methyltransferase